MMMMLHTLLSLSLGTTVTPKVTPLSNKTTSTVKCNSSSSSSSCKTPRIVKVIVKTTLSLTLLLVHPPLSPSLALDSPPEVTVTVTEEEESCIEDDVKSAPPLNVVEEAWQIVNDAFLDTTAPNPRWSPDTWLKKKEEMLRSSITTRSKAHNIIQKMLSSLGDPYTRFLSPEEGDEILSVNDVDVRGTSAFEVSSLLQGPSETSVIVKVRHGNCGPVQTVIIQRQSVARSPVFYRLEQIDDGATSVGYVRLKEFNALARRDIVIAMTRLQNLGASCFVLDLRDNLGGLVQAGIEIAKLFLDRGDTVISIAGRDQSQNAIVAETSPLVTAPVIVLVNHNTASASEIVASALHDNCRAVLVGDKTYGKGLIQSVFELHDGSGVAITIGKYVTPGHLDINGNGIEPDFPNIPRWSKVAERLSTCNRLRPG